MKNYKKVIAGLLTATMVMGSTGVVFAGGSEGSSTGEGELEGVLNSDVYDVVLPTVSAGTFDFILDPEGLIDKTDAGRYEGATFTGTSGMFFKNDESSYSDKSNAFKVINKSSTEVTLDVTATVTDLGDNVALVGLNASDAPNFTTGNDAVPEIYLALTDGAQTTPEVVPVVTTPASGDTPAVSEAELADKTLDDADDQYAVKWDDTNEKYVKELKPVKKDGDPDSGDYLDETAFDEYSFNLVGACNKEADWTGLENIQPKVEVVWAVSVDYDTDVEPEAPVGPQIAIDADGFSVTGLTADRNYRNMILEAGGLTQTFADVQKNCTLNTENWNSTSGGDMIATFGTGWKSYLSGKTVKITVELTDGTSIEKEVTLD